MKAHSLSNRADLIARQRRGHQARAIDGDSGLLGIPGSVSRSPTEI